MSRSDQSRPSKRLKHAHTATNGRELPNGVGALLDSKSGPDRGQKLKAKLSNDKVKNSRIAQLDESRTVVQANGDVEMQDQPAGIIEISSDAGSDLADSSAGEEEEDEEAEKHNGVQENQYDKEKRGQEADGITADQNEALNQFQSLKSLKRGKRVREEDAFNRQMDDGGDAQTTSQIALQDRNETDRDTMNEEPSFGELLQAQAPAEPIDVTSAFASGEYKNNSLMNRKDHAATTTSSTRNTYNGPITANSLGTVLTQALRTNDNDLLESCLGLTDYAGVRATIERLPSHLATTLLLRLAERLHRRPGRAGNLMIWVQWSLVAHGGYLASQTEAAAKLSILQRVVRERADGLQPLLRLKGKLDMLAAQLELRKKMKQRRPERGTGADDEDGDDDEEDDEGIIYVEGAEKADDDDDDDDDEGENDIIVDDEDELQQKPSERKAKKRKTSSKNNTSNSTTTTRPEETNSSSETDTMPTTAATSLADGIRNGSYIDRNDDDGEDEEEEDEDKDEDGNLIDDEAEETDRDTGDDDDDDLSDGSDLDGFIDDGEDLEGNLDEDDEEEVD